MGGRGDSVVCKCVKFIRVCFWCRSLIRDGVDEGVVGNEVVGIDN